MFSKIKLALSKIIASPLAGRLLALVFGNQIPCWRYGGLKFDCSSPAITDQTKASIFWGIYEGSEIRFAQKYLSNDLDVVELGGSIGVLSSHLARRVSPKRFISVEAWPAFEPIIRRNWAINGATNAELILKAIGAPGEKLYFKIGDQNDTGTVANEAASGTVEIDSTSLSQVLAEQKIGKFALICDIEGSEISILLNDEKALENCQLIIIETHHTEYKGVKYSPEFMLKKFKSLGFELIDQHIVNLVLQRKNPSA